MSWEYFHAKMQRRKEIPASRSQAPAWERTCLRSSSFVFRIHLLFLNS